MKHNSSKLNKLGEMSEGEGDWCPYLMKAYMQPSCRILTACIFKLLWCHAYIFHVTSQH
jgi:hypothetical protein